MKVKVASPTQSVFDRANSETVDSVVLVLGITMPGSSRGKNSTLGGTLVVGSRYFQNCNITSEALDLSHDNGKYPPEGVRPALQHIGC